MPKLKVLSGKDIVKILEHFNFCVVSQKGSHIKLQRAEDYHKQILVIPNHPELDRGTIKAIFNQASKYISEQELGPYFYN